MCKQNHISLQYMVGSYNDQYMHTTKTTIKKLTLGNEEDHDDIIYNPKNLPLGWDGKPIPYWLYKLHGLNIDYKCQICGNQTYRGPKAFQRHFSEWRHAHGMRCLGTYRSHCNCTVSRDQF